MTARYVCKAGPLALVLLVLLPRPSFALATEHFGHDPVAPGFLNLPAAALALANLASRFYWREVNGDPQFYYRGDTDALNEALRKLAAVDGVKELVLLPGPGSVSSLTGEKRMACDWSVHTPAGFSFASVLRGKSRNLYPAEAVLTAYIPAARPGPPADPAAVARWIGELDHEDFDVRERASRELEKAGPTAGPALRRLRAGAASAEALRRAGLLLDKLPGIDLDRLVVPPGVSVVEVKDLVARYRVGLRNQDATVRGLCAGFLARLADHDPAVLPLLVDVLRRDPHEYVRRCVAGAFSGLGREGAVALPILKDGLRDPDANIRGTYQQAIDKIGAAPEDPGRDERRARQRAILDDIARFRQSLPAR